jgi:RND family efflux transporter MFP subunit
MILSKSVPFLVGLAFICLPGYWGYCSPADLRVSLAEPAHEPGIHPSRPEQAKPLQGSAKPFRTEAAVIRPFRQATVAAEVSGVVEARYFEEGDAVNAGDIIFELSRERYKLFAKKSHERLLALDAALERAGQNLKLKEYLFSHNAATRQEVLRAGTEAKIAEHRRNEAEDDFELARRDVEKSLVRAPFKGYIVAFYRKPHETVQRFEQLFLIADTSRVYAVVNVPETHLPRLRKGSRAVFVRPSGKRFDGTVAIIGKAIDPASRTKKVHVLIDNAQGKLEMGMLGAVEFFPGQRGNP